MRNKIFYSLLLTLGVTYFSNAQFGFSHEVGAFVGPVNFRSDFGESENTRNNLGNTGFGVGLVHYMNFSYRAECNCYTPETYFNDHFKLRSELSYTKTKLDHFGKWADKQSPGGAQLRSMHGEANVTDIGMQLEYFPWSIRQFTATDGAWGPFVALGAHYSFYKPHTYTDYGNGEVSALSMPLWPKYYDGGVNNDGGSTWSVVSSLGTRYKLTELSDLFVELRWQYYFSNWVEGVSPDPNIYTENKANDWNLWLNFGYIYYLD
ncbi:THC0290_0291 family protein [Flavobacterium urocaniciphilum]|uniref:Glutamate dehydrogenase n=1 Tax=Flavobacterium urocaniciphilum TaxID=1299341 RepID=A0A1H9E1S0_9FLAO|nr:glutamate dehydrogenase [Flavobacterium urocaniciphilum]SEQ19517.1 hypothetical protein SAMN05444005_10936 [Flavobacterium urocaniciphilum]